MTNINNSLATILLRRRALWFALLPIALLQLTIALHQFDHVAEYVEDSCHVCVQLDRLDMAVDHVAEKGPQPSIDVLWSKSPSISASREALRNFDARAPPGL